jgi:hypothetical protein
VGGVLRYWNMRPDLSAIVRSTKEEGPWEHSPGFSLRRYFYKAIGLKDRRKQLVPYNRNPQSPFHHNGFFAGVYAVYSSTPGSQILPSPDLFRPTITPASRPSMSLTAA